MELMKNCLLTKVEKYIIISLSNKNLDLLYCRSSNNRHPYIDFRTTEGMMPLEQSQSTQNIEPDSITEEEIALVDEQVMNNINRNK